MIYKLSLVLLTTFASASAMKLQKVTPLADFDTNNLIVTIPSSQVRTQNITHKVDLLCDNQGFMVQEEGKTKRIQSYDTDKLFRDKNLKQVLMYAACLNKFKVSKLDNGDYVLYANGELKGGGLFGANAGFWIGKLGVSFIGHGTLLVIAACTGPAAPATLATLEAAFGPAIEGCANVAGIGTAIAVGTATGPV